MRKCLFPLTSLLFVLLTSTFFISTVQAETKGDSLGLARVVIPVSFDFTVKDSEGNPISEALVEVMDKYGTQFTVETRYNGSIPTQIIYANVAYTISVLAKDYYPFSQIFETSGNMIWGVIMTFNSSVNILLLVFSVLSILASGMFFNRDRDIAWGAISTFLWFVTAMAMMADSQDNWIYSRVFGMFGTIMVVLTVVSVIQRLNPRDQYFDDWE